MMRLRVEVKDEIIVKPFLGGWKHKSTGTIYHNAASQTGPLVRYNVANVCSRGVQFINIKDNSCQPSIDKATQMWRPDCYISSEGDKYKSAKPYESYEERERRLDRNGKAKIIQRTYRSWKIIKTMAECAMTYKKMVDDCKKFEEEKAELLKKRNQLSIIRQTFPQSHADFDKIYSLIESWRQFHSNEARKKFFRGAIVAENCRLLENNVKILKNAEEHRRIIIERYKNKQLENFLIFNCKPKQWIGYKGKFIEMVTLRVQKARETKCLYDRLNSSNCTTEERVELLILLKRSVELHNCHPAMDLIKLIDQEIILSTRGIKGLSLGNLKRRISLAFLYFIRHSHDCCLNSNRDMELSDPIERDKILCRSCMRLLPKMQFTVHAKIKKLSTCIYCSRLHQQNVEKIDYDPYMYLLNGIRAEELKRKCFSSLLYVIQEPEIYHLVKNIWHGRSIVSEGNDISCLRLIRFHVDIEWAPWNCILLTEEEGKAHFFNQDVCSMYSKELLKKIALMHEVAKCHFKDLVKLERKFHQSPHYCKMMEDDTAL